MNRINYPFRLGKAIDDAAPVNTEGKSSNPTSTNVPALGEYVKKQGQEKGKIVIDGGRKIYSDIMGRFGGNKEISSALSEDQVRKSDKELRIEDSAKSKFVDQHALLIDDEADGNLAIKKGKDLLHGRKPELKIMNKKMAPPEENLYKVVMELVGPASGEDRTAVNIIVILDITGSMKNEKLERLKSAMRILISKLNPTDSLSVITFKYQLFMTQFQLMSKNGKEEIERVVNDLRHAEHAPNIAVFLEKAALEVSRNSVSAIFLMSDGDPSRDYTDAAKIPLPDVPLYKFTFAHEYQADGMYTIGKSNDRGGTFPLGNEGDMNVAFSQCFYELSDIVVEDLKLIFTPIMAEFEDSNLTPKIVKVSAGNCEQSKDDSTGSVTVLMNGEFYRGEIRRLIVDLLLPAVTSQTKTNVLKISYSYNFGGERFECSDIQVDVIRTVAELQTIDPMGRLKEQVQIAITQSKTIGEALKHNQGLLRGGQLKNTDSLAHLKGEILATIQLYDSIKDSLKSILDAHTPIIKAEIPDDVVKQVVEKQGEDTRSVEHDPLDSVVSLKHKILEAIHNSNSIQASFKQHQSLLKRATNLMLEKTTGGKLALNEGETILKDDSLENMKAEILCTMRQYDSIKESLKFVQGTLNKDMALQSMG